MNWKRTGIFGFVVAGAVLAAGAVGATPTTNIWNPNTDVQAAGTLHVGIDNYFSVKDNASRPVAFPTDVGLTYGAGSGFEVGIDVNEPTSKPLFFNAKWGMPEKKTNPAFALGIQGVGASKSTQSNIVYGLLAKSFGKVGRFTAGAYHGSESVIGSENTGAILAWDKTFTDKWWGSVDYASGHNAYGALAVGGAYKFAPNAGLLLGYVFFNNSSINPNDTFTSQVDFDF